MLHLFWLSTKLVTCFTSNIACSHFSYEKAKQTEMVVDIQGVATTYTDPQLHSVEKIYGRADRGELGFHKFFGTHKSNFLCKLLELLPEQYERLQ